jgi:hypothetical protein
MPKSKRRVRVQSAKPSAMRTGSPVAREATLRSGAGVHKGQGEYVRRPKHVSRGWDE